MPLLWGGKLSWESTAPFPWHQCKKAAAAVVPLWEEINAFLHLLQQLNPLVCSEGLCLVAGSSGRWGSVCCTLQTRILISFGF